MKFPALPYGRLNNEGIRPLRRGGIQLHGYHPGPLYCSSQSYSSDNAGVRDYSVPLSVSVQPLWKLLPRHGWTVPSESQQPVQGPWWTDGPEHLLSPHALTVDWLDGVREKTLHINISTGELSIDLGGELSRFRFPESWTPRFFPLSSKTGIGRAKKAFGCSWIPQGTGAEIYAPFGSRSLAEDSR